MQVYCMFTCTYVCIHIYKYILYKRVHTRKTTHTVQYLQYISTSIPETWIITTSLFDNVDHVCKTLSLSLAGMDPIRLMETTLERNKPSHSWGVKVDTKLYATYIRVLSSPHATLQVFNHASSSSISNPSNTCSITLSSCLGGLDKMCKMLTLREQECTVK